MSTASPSRPASGVETLRWGGERLRAGPWRGDLRIAQVQPAGDGRPPSRAAIDRCLRRLAEQGYTRVLTGALNAVDAGVFQSAGFSVEERLALLSHDLRELPARGRAGVRVHRARASHHAAVLAVDDAAFPVFWRLGPRGLRDALDATPVARFRAAAGADDGIIGYAVTGRAARRGYLQRLAVDPAHQGAGVGTALVVDGLRWLRRWRVTRAVVNTQVENTGALALYEHLGFRREPTGLSVLALELA